MLSNPSRRGKLEWLMIVIGLLLVAIAVRRLGPGIALALGLGSATVCAVIGWIVGAGFGIATAGMGFSAAPLFAAAGAASCGWVGPIAVALGFDGPPWWAMPLVFVGGLVAALGCASKIVHMWLDRRDARLERRQLPPPSPPTLG